MKTLGLSSRLALVLVLVVVALQAISVLGFLRFQQADIGSWRLPVPVRIAAAASALDRTEVEQRDELLVAMNGDATRFFITGGTPEGYREWRGALPVLLQGYGRLQARDVRVLMVEGDGPFRTRPFERRTVGYAISVALADGQRLVVAPGFVQQRRGVAIMALLFNLLVGLVAAIFVWRMVRRATEDFEVIASASDRFAIDLSAPPMGEQGGVEARRVAAAFNRMRTRIQTLLDERMRMLAAVAHDLKTLLTRLRLRAFLISDDEQRARADCDIALMATLIEDVLMVARGEERPAKLVPVDVAALLEDVAHERTAIGEAVIAGRLDRGLVLAEPVGLRRIIENLVGNAVAYAGSAELQFEIERDQWQLRVVDHGPGLPEGFSTQAFEPFARGESSRSRETGGTGLGLSIARSLARNMGGEVYLATTPGGGVTAQAIFAREAAVGPQS